METIAQALAILEDTDQKEKERVDAAHYLGKNGSEETAFALVAALDDDDYGVHWAASEGLALLGEAAMPALLKALADANCSPRVIHGAKHAFHTSSSSVVRAEARPLVAAMHGPDQDIAVIQAASELMTKLRIA